MRQKVSHKQSVEFKREILPTYLVSL